MIIKKKTKITTFLSFNLQIIDGVSTHLIVCCSYTLPVVLKTITRESLTTPNIVSDILVIMGSWFFPVKNKRFILSVVTYNKYNVNYLD